MIDNMNDGLARLDIRPYHLGVGGIGTAGLKGHRASTLHHSQRFRVIGSGQYLPIAQFLGCQCLVGNQVIR